jgi:hypothetical protein
MSLSWTHSRSRHFDLGSKRFVINGLSGSLINPVMRFGSQSRSEGSISAQGPDGFLKGGGGVFGNEAVLVLHLPTAVQELTDFYPGLGIGSSE